jgi:hypothetical protein
VDKKEEGQKTMPMTHYPGADELQAAPLVDDGTGSHQFPPLDDGGDGSGEEGGRP